MLNKIKFLGVWLIALMLGAYNVRAVTIQESIDNGESSVTFKLDKEYQENLTIGSGKKLILDLNGNTLRGNISINGGELTVNDSTNNGKIITTNNIGVSNGKFTLNGGNIESANYAIYGLNGSLITINGGVITAKNDWACLGSNNTTGDAEFIINGGTLNANYQTVYIANPIGLTINGGTLNGGIAMRMGKLTINGGTINATKASASSFDDIKDYYNLSDGFAWTADAIHFMGGTYTTNSTKGNALEVNITGGNINVENGLGSAVVVYDIGKVSQNITINISKDAKLVTDATSRGSFDVMNLADIGVTNPKAGYGVYSGNVKTNIMGGVYSDEPAPELIPDKYEVYEVIEGNNKGSYIVVSDNDLKDTASSKSVKEEDVNTNDVSLIEKEIKDKYSFVGYYDVSVVKTTTDGDVVGTIEETDEPVEVLLGVPSSLPAVKTGFIRKYYVIRVHNGEVTIIDDVKDNGDGTVTFKSDKFSTYALAYTDVEENIKSPNTFDGISIYLFTILISFVVLAFSSIALKNNN